MTKLISYNCQNFKANKLMIEKLVNYSNVLFLIEHWLCDSEKYMIENSFIDKKVIFYSHYDKRINTKGRPFGGLCWIIDKDFKVLESNLINNHIAKITLNDERTGILNLYGVWLPFDDNRIESHAKFEQSLSLLETELNKDYLSEQSSIILGDFNADTERKKNLMFDWRNLYPVII